MSINPPGTRTDTLRRLIWPKLCDDPANSAKNIWNLLRREVEDAEDDYDLDFILPRIDDTELVWEDEKSKERTLAFGAFENRVSNLKTLAKKVLTALQ